MNVSQLCRKAKQGDKQAFVQAEALLLKQIKIIEKELKELPNYLNIDSYKDLNDFLRKDVLGSFISDLSLYVKTHNAYTKR